MAGGFSRAVLLTIGSGLAMGQVAARPLFAQPAPLAGSSGSDAVIQANALAAVRGYAQFTIFDDVWVEVGDGIARLGGKVTQPIKKLDLVRRIAAVAGVRSVVDELSILPVSRFDDELRDAVARAIYGHVHFWTYAVMPNPPIHIIVERSRVTLTGVVRTAADRLLARTLAMQSDALSVTVQLQTDAEVNGTQ